MVHVFEFFSGIGGMRIALEEATRDLEMTVDKVSAFDTSPFVNRCYEHYFPESEVRRVNIETIKLKDLDGDSNMNIIWTMSPPCQPFTMTKGAKQLDIADARNKAFMFLMKVLDTMKNKPEWIFFENVKGFLGSETHGVWCDTLERNGYTWRQYLLTPFQFRVPNHRMRFYMVCRRDPLEGYNNNRSDVFEKVRNCECTSIKSCKVNGRDLNSEFLEIKEDIGTVHEIGDNGTSGPLEVHGIQNYILPRASADELFLDEKSLQGKFSRGLSFVGMNDRCTFCFTSNYGRTLHKAVGSLFHVQCNGGKLIYREPDMARLHLGMIRRFDPKEILNIFGFPEDYCFPENTSTVNRFAGVGQSINIVVVRALIHSELCFATSST